MFLTSYSTNAGAPFFSKELPTRLTLARAEGILINPVPGNLTLFALVDTGPRSKDIPPFDHPVQVDSTSGNFWVVDLRPYASRILRPGGELVIPEESPAALAILRAGLEMYWNQYGSAEVLYFGDLPMVVFSRWLSGLLRTNCNLDELGLAKVQCITAFYYLCLHYTEASFGKQQYEAAARKINRILGLPFDTVKNLVQQLPYMQSLSDYTDALSTYVDDPGLRVVTPTFIYNVTMTSWFGSSNSRALICVSLEFPPAFIAMVVAAGKSSQQRKSQIGQAVEREKNRWRYNEYVTLVSTSLKTLK